MKACVLYYSRTGNTRRFAEAISQATGAPIFRIEESDATNFTDYDLLFIGTPVTGFSAAPQVIAFVKKLPLSSGKQTILFCTCAIAKGQTFSVLEKELVQRGYNNILCVSKRGIKPKEAEFKDAVETISKRIAHNN
jgi:flavodoxin